MNDELLSRLAENLFWTGRYVERADDTARLVDVYVHRMLSDPAVQGNGAGADSGPLFRHPRHRARPGRPARRRVGPVPPGL